MANNRKNQTRKKHYYEEPDYARKMIQLYSQRAREGHQDAIDSIIKWLEKFPELKPEYGQLSDLSAKTEAAWAKAVSFGDLIAEQAAIQEVTIMKADLLEGSTSLLDQMLASTVVVAKLSYDRAAQAAAKRSEHTAVNESRDRRLSAAQKRLVAATKAWQIMATKKAKGLHPRSKLKIFDTEAA